MTKITKHKFVWKMSFVRYECLKNIFRTFWISERCLVYVMDVSKMSFIRYGCLKNVFYTLCISKVRSLARLKGQFIKITKDLTTQERLLFKIWQKIANKKNKNDQNKTYKWRVRGSPRSQLYLKRVLVNTWNCK